MIQEKKPRNKTILFIDYDIIKPLTNICQQNIWLEKKHAKKA
jgi:hypothetical protein